VTFKNQKKTFLDKSDQSKKGSIDEKVKPLLNTINEKNNYYTTSSCSGRTYFWKGEKKNQTEWFNITHDLINNGFFKLNDTSGLIWLRYEPLILHVCCKDLDAANLLVEEARKIFKKSSILTVSKKIIVEIAGSEKIEMPYLLDGNKLFSGEDSWLKDLINSKLKLNWEKIDRLRESIEKLIKIK
jgi:tRNA wybutosine-synthesizing protein 3